PPAPGPCALRAPRHSALGTRHSALGTRHSALIEPSPYTPARGHDGKLLRAGEDRVSEKNNERSLMQALALFSQLGISVAIPLGLFTYLGYFGDQKLGTGPVLLLVGMAIGALTAFYTLYRMLKDATS